VDLLAGRHGPVVVVAEVNTSGTPLVDREPVFRHGLNDHVGSEMAKSHLGWPLSGQLGEIAFGVARGWS
jgi:hypothetical protein